MPACQRSLSVADTSIPNTYTARLRTGLVCGRVKTGAFAQTKGAAFASLASPVPPATSQPRPHSAALIALHPSLIPLLLVTSPHANLSPLYHIKQGADFLAFDVTMDDRLLLHFLVIVLFRGLHLGSCPWIGNYVMRQWSDCSMVYPCRRPFHPPLHCLARGGWAI